LCKPAGYFPYVLVWFLYGILYRNVKRCKTYAGVPRAAGINFRTKGLVSLPTTVTFEGSCVMRYQAGSIGEVADISMDGGDFEKSATIYQPTKCNVVEDSDMQ
jgi:hypothetical protein